MWIQISFNQDWKTSPAKEVYPPFNLLIFSSCIFLNSHAAVWSPISSGWLSKTGLGGKAASSGWLYGFDVRLPCIVSTNFTNLDWWLGVKFASSSSMSSNEALFIMGVVIFVECEATAVPCLVFTVPSTELKISSCMWYNLDSVSNVTAFGVLGGLWGLASSDNFNGLLLFLNQRW